VLLRAELDQRFTIRSAEMLGGDLVLLGSEPPSGEQLTLLSALDQGLVADFPTVLVHGDEMLLVSARAADAGYPVYGQLQHATGRFEAATPAGAGPAAGEVWLADQALDRLGLAIGDTVQVGRQPLTLTAVI